MVNLHTHSEHSTGFDGYQTIPEMVGRAKELGYPALALTDHGTMSGILDFSAECEKQGIKPIYGMEAYFCANHTVKDKTLTHHLVLLAMNEQGYYNLKKMDSISYTEDYYYYKGRIDKALLSQYHEGLICLSACMASIVNTADGESWFSWFKDLFGDRFYAEIQPLNLMEQQEYNAKVIALAKQYDVPLVVTTDAHFARKEDLPYHKLWVSLRGGNGYHDDENYLWSEDEIRDTLWIPDDVKDECIANTHAIAERCNVSLKMEGNHYPKFETDDDEKQIRDICRKAWKAKVPKGKYKEYGERFEAEIKTLKQVGYLNYLLITWDMLNWCHDNDIMTGWGRGSVGGSLVAYLMGLHKIDPIKFGTKFFRFVNPYRVSPPDIDDDVSTRHRGRVIDYLKEKYGNVSKIFTLNRLGDPDKGGIGKSAIQRAGQALQIEPSVIDEITKQVYASIDDVLTIDSVLSTEERERLADVAKHFYGRLEKRGIHASAILITPDEIENYCPLEGCYSTDTSTGKRVWIRAAAYDWHKLESEFGLLKEDILGLNTLDLISDTIEGVKKSTGETVDIENIPLDDAEVYRLYSEGHLDGVFQMESRGMRGTAKELGVTCFDDVAALVALFRPGPIDSGMLQQYIDGKHGAEIQYPCDVMRKVTEKTYGVIVYQEEAMLIAMQMAGYNLGEADALRKVIGRKELTKVDAAVKDFIAAAVKRGHTREAAEAVGEQLKAAGRYIFNLAHSVEYGLTSYVTAWLKVHYPVHFMCALMNSKDKQADILPYLDECKRLGIEILPPDAKRGNTLWEVEDGNKIRVGLTYISGIGNNLKTGSMDVWEDIVATNNKKVTMNLIKAGALDYLGKSRGWMLANLESTQGYLRRREQCLNKVRENQEGLDNATDDKARKKYQRQLDSWQAKLDEVQLLESAEDGYDEIAGEIEVLSFSFKSIPKILTGIAKSVNEFQDKKGNTMARITFSTPYGNKDGLVFASAWKKEKYRHRDRGMVRGITIEQGKQYEFMIEKGVIVDARERDG